jgi:hypothetical protein
MHAEGLREYIDNFRRRMFTECGAAAFWDFQRLLAGGARVGDRRCVLSPRRRHSMPCAAHTRR